MEKLDEGLKTLLDLGKRRGFLTFDQVNDFLPDEASSPEKIHSLLESLDELGIELVNEEEAEARLLASGDLDDEPDDLADEPADEEDGELTPEDLDEISRREKIWWELMLELERETGAPVGAMAPEDFRARVEAAIDPETFQRRAA